MEIRPVEGENGYETAGFVVEVLGEVDHRLYRHEACERVMAVLERDVDKLKRQVEWLMRKLDAARPKQVLRQAPAGGPSEPSGDGRGVSPQKTAIFRRGC
jgi:hypothetical protein